MTEERSCGTCGHYVSDRCVRPGGCCFHHSNWQPIAQCKYGMNNCQFLGNEDTCAICAETGFGLSEFLPNKRPIAQDKPMENKVIFESVEEFDNYWFSCGIGIVGCHEYNVVKRRSIEHGYIRKSAVEQAEEIYKEWLNRIGYMSETVVMYKMYLAIQELKSEIERLKK
jgi:hypothetical protein